jgi:hypothetical protein
LTDLTQEMDLWREFLSRALTWRMPSPRVWRHTPEDGILQDTDSFAIRKMLIWVAE